MRHTGMLLAAAAGIFLLAAALGHAMATPRQETIATAEGPLEIYAVHHASLLLTFQGKHIFVDPAPVEEKGNAIAEFRALPKPDLILYTHDHYDHFNAGILEAIVGPETVILAPAEVAAAIPSALRPRVQVMANGDKTTALGLPVEATAMYNTTPEHAKFHPKGAGNGYVLGIGGKRIYIAGDTEEVPENAHLGGIDAAFVPMNQPYTMTVAAAAHWVKDFKPALVYPYHYRNADGTQSDLAAFTAAVGGASTVKLLKWY